MKVDLIFRLIGMATLAGLGLYSGIILSNNGNATVYIYAGIGALVGAVLGWIFTPFLTIRPASALRNLLNKVPSQTLLVGLVGLIVGLIIAALLSIPLSSFPQPFGSVFSVLGALLITYLSVALFVTRQHEIIDFFHFRSQARTNDKQDSEGTPPAAEEPEPARTILLDTSVIIDGKNRGRGADRISCWQPAHSTFRPQRASVYRGFVGWITTPERPAWDGSPISITERCHPPGKN